MHVGRSQPEELREAEDLVREALDNDDALFGLAQLFDQQGMVAGAEQLCRRAIIAGNVRAIFYLAVTVEDRGDMQETELLYRQAIDADSGTDAMNNLAHLLAHRGATQEAERLYRQAVTGGSSRAQHNLTNLGNPPKSAG